MCATIAGTSVRFEFSVTGTPSRYPSGTEEAILRVCQEAVSNAVRHANAPHVRMHMNYSSEALAVLVADDGAGFDVSTSNAGGDGHWGLATMQERARQAGLELVPASQPGVGTEIHVTATRTQSGVGA